MLLKGGHRQEQTGTDTLYYKNSVHDIPGEAFKNKKDKHGTGCVLSSAIAAYIAQGEGLLNACRKAKQYVEKFIQSNAGNLGYHI